MMAGSNPAQHDSPATLFVAAQPRHPGGRLGRLRARAKLEAGVPLLHGESLALDIPFVLRTAARLLASWSEREGDVAAEAVRWLAAGRLDAARLVEEAFVGHRDHLAQLAAPAGRARDVLIEALELAARPLLRRAAEAASEHLALVPWQRRYCPIFGTAGEPDEGGASRCPRCLTRWPGAESSGSPAFELELGLPGAGEEEDWRDD